MDKVELIISARPRDIGGFFVRRILPYATHQMVGPFTFFDHFGPVEFLPGEGIEVRPHPHLNLATVTYLFEGKIRHRDSLGSDQLIEPGAINWMIAGKGIVHSERTPEDLRKSRRRLHGIQLWIALPEESENIAPSFTHHPANTLPEFEVDGVRLRLLAGTAFGHSSPVPAKSDFFYLEADFSPGAELVLPANGGHEAAVYVIEGHARVDDKDVQENFMAIARAGESLHISAREKTRLMLLGGKPVGKRHIYWNFVSSSEENIEKAKADWALGPGHSARFPKVPGDDQEFIPLPIEPPVGS